jgi:hypothetical protein
VQPNRGKFFAILLLALVLEGAAQPVPADEACVDFKWDVSKERALFAETPDALTAGRDPMSAPVVVPNHLYRLKLTIQDRAAFSVAPARKTAGGPAYAGLATLKTPAAGTYRIAVDLPLWIDVVSNGVLVPPTDFQGQRACGAPHKIVEFELSGAQPFVLQLSSAAKDEILLTVTPAPPRKL